MIIVQLVHLRSHFPLFLESIKHNLIQEKEYIKYICACRSRFGYRVCGSLSKLSQLRPLIMILNRRWDDLKFSKICSCKIASLKSTGSRSLWKGRLWYNAQTTLSFHCITLFWNLKHFHSYYSEHDESLSNVTFNSLLLDSDNIKSDCLGDWSALPNSDNITHSSSFEGWG